MVKSISRAVQDLIDRDLPLQHALEMGYGNYSAIARILHPKVEETLDRKVKLESIITSVKRAKVSYEPLKGNITKVIANSVINLRTDVAKISVEKTKRTLKTIRKALADFPSEEFLQILEGVSAITLIFDQKLLDNIHKMFRDEEILGKKRNLAAITVHSPPEIIETPGCTIAFYNPISRGRINIEETMSCFTDTIILLHMENVGKAFTALTDLVARARKTMGN